MPVRIPRLPDATTWSGDLPQGTGPAWLWWDTPEADFGWSLLVRCSHGLHYGVLSAAKHTIDGAGVVSPSILFTPGMCGDQEPFHEFGVLEGWGPEDAARLESRRGR